MHKAIPIAVIVVLVILITYHYKFREKFMPVPLLRCGNHPAPDYAVDVTGRGAVGTVVWAPSNYESFTNKKETFMSSSEPTNVSSIEEIAPSDSLLARATGRSPTPPKRVANATVLADLDSDLVSGGVSDSSVMPSTRNTVSSPKKKHLLKGVDDARLRLLMNNVNTKLKTKYFNPRATPTPDVLRMGLGSVYMDPRYQPGPQKRIGGAYGVGPAPGGFAGGPTYGALTPSVFAPGGDWDAAYVKGFGGQYGPDVDVGAIPVEALITNSS